MSFEFKLHATGSWRLKDGTDAFHHEDVTNTLSGYRHASGKLLSLEDLPPLAFKSSFEKALRRVLDKIQIATPDIDWPTLMISLSGPRLAGQPPREGGEF